MCLSVSSVLSDCSVPGVAGVLSVPVTVVSLVSHNRVSGVCLNVSSVLSDCSVAGVLSD